MLQKQNEYLSRMHITVMKDLKSVHEELSATAVQLASARSELTAALPTLKSTENELRIAKSDLTITCLNHVDGIAKISSLKTSLELMSHSYEQEKLEKEAAEKRLVTSSKAQPQCLKPLPISLPTTWINFYSTHAPLDPLDAFQTYQDARLLFKDSPSSIMMDDTSDTSLSMHNTPLVPSPAPSHNLNQCPVSLHSCPPTPSLEQQCVSLSPPFHQSILDDDSADFGTNPEESPMAQLIQEYSLVGIDSQLGSTETSIMWVLSLEEFTPDLIVDRGEGRPHHYHLTKATMSGRFFCIKFIVPI